MSCIYFIENKLDGRMYIANGLTIRGMRQNIEDRLK